MPSEHSPAETDDRERFHSIQAEIGEDPARWLDRPLFGGPQGTSEPGIMIRARVRGIDDLLVIRYWLEVEHQLERGPRDRVIQMLRDRAAELQAIGERDGRVEPSDGRETPAKDWYLVRECERIPWSEVDRGVRLGGRARIDEGGASA